MDALHKIGFKVRMIATQSSLHFLNLETLKTKLGESVLVDKDEWEAWGKRGDPVLHIQVGFSSPINPRRCCAPFIDFLSLESGLTCSWWRLCQRTPLPNFLTALLTIFWWASDFLIGLFSDHKLYLMKTCVARAWDFSRPFLVCPAMNSMMLHHPVTAPQLNTLRGFGITVVPTVSKKLMCGDTGDGAMADVATIVSFVSETKLNVT